MTEPKNTPTSYRVAHLNPHQPTEFALAPDAARRQALAGELDLRDLPRLDFSGRIRAIGNDSWRVEGRLSARVVQPCVVTLAPVTTDLHEDVERIFSPHVTPPEGEEVEMPDDAIEPLGQFIDLDAIMAEAIALALPLYPRARGAALDAHEEPPAEETRKPFSGLADLLGKGGE
ncbi:Uncharacterized metal-binding protein YceD, DUF177 family [Paracoccus halophilus]|uniref:Uncharacterized metal-binding protein YceD, DUF177 family n=1 Tax=Paracoccus halophilus TaxID=376733 RepID=A0A099F014_9RHOB|nr:DUF177 domain-containing protein [Paracoccus halophilus]KGJ03583.1 hypothetical protein IT41_13265 [Paracoccus halophilus]SFA58179.1 Uncharacterized metal-binding protein YceD, DUF177 family [Paracoccus halophilus]